MRIGFDVAPLYGKSRGVRRYVEELEKELKLDERTQIKRVGPGSRHGSSLEKIYSARKIGFVARQISEVILAPIAARKACDLLHYTDTYGPLIGGTPYVITVHDTTFLTHPQDHDAWVTRWLAEMSRKTWGSAKKIISVSETTADDLLAAGVSYEKIRVIPHGIDHTMARPLTTGTEAKFDFAQTRYLSYLGNIEPRKGLPTLISAFQMALPDLPSDVKLFVAGSEVWGPAFEQIDSHITDRITFLGPLPDSQLKCYLENAEVFVYPSKYEGFGLPPLEALSVGTRVIVGDTPAARETLGDKATYFTPGEAGQLAREILRLFNAADTIEERNSRVLYSKKFSWSEASRRTVDVYREALEL